MTPIQIAVLLFATLSLGIVALLQVWGAREQRREILVAADAAPRWRESRSSRLDAAFEKTATGRKVAALLAGAGLGTWSSVTAVMTLVAAEVLVGVLVDELFGTVTAVIAVVVVALGAHRWLEGRRRARTERFIAQLPELARLLANGAQAGLGMRRSIELAARELEDPAASELGQVSSELAVGRSLDSALEHLQQRLPSKELAVLVQTLVIQARAGGALVTALGHIATTLDERRQLAREARTASAGAVFTGYIVMIMGSGSVLLVNVMSPGALDEMVTNPLGVVALVGAAVFFGAGYVAIRQITKVDL